MKKQATINKVIDSSMQDIRNDIRARIGKYFNEVNAITVKEIYISDMDNVLQKLAEIVDFVSGVDDEFNMELLINVLQKLAEIVDFISGLDEVNYRRVGTRKIRGTSKVTTVIKQIQRNFWFKFTCIVVKKYFNIGLVDFLNDYNDQRDAYVINQVSQVKNALRTHLNIILTQNESQELNTGVSE
jgi:hypothetical protein